MYLYIAAGIAVLAAVLTGVTFQGFSRLGRAVTLSAVETARVIDGELFVRSGTNSEREGLLNANGAVAVRYGVVAGRLALTEQQRIRVACERGIVELDMLLLS